MSVKCILGSQWAFNSRIRGSIPPVFTIFFLARKCKICYTNKMKFKFRFDKRFNDQVLEENRLKLISRQGLNVVVEGTFWDFIQLKNYPFVKDMANA